MAPRLKVGPRKRRRGDLISFDLRLAHGRHCPYCHRVMHVLVRRLKQGRPVPANFPTRDHVIPKSRMPAQGTLIVCKTCNGDKADRTLVEWHAYLKHVGDPRAEIIARLMKDEEWRRHPTFVHGR